MPMRATNCSWLLRALWRALSSGLSLRVSAAWRARSLASTGVDFPAGRSRIWPILDLTIKSLPRYLLMVFALAGDSTITRVLPMSLNLSLVDRTDWCRWRSDAFFIKHIFAGYWQCPAATGGQSDGSQETLGLTAAPFLPRRMGSGARIEASSAVSAVSILATSSTLPVSSQ